MFYTLDVRIEVRISKEVSEERLSGWLSLDSPESNQADLNRCTHPWELLKRPGRKKWMRGTKAVNPLCYSGLTTSLLCRPLMCNYTRRAGHHRLNLVCISNLQSWSCSGSRCSPLCSLCVGATLSETCLPSKRPSSPDGSSETGG